MRIKEIFVSDDGKEFDNKSDCIAHEGNFVCPACDGVGHTIKNPNPYEYYGSLLEKRVKCKRCNEKGFTSKELKPVTKVVGYEVIN